MFQDSGESGDFLVAAYDGAGVRTGLWLQDALLLLNRGLIFMVKFKNSMPSIKWFTLDV